MLAKILHFGAVLAAPLALAGTAAAQYSDEDTPAGLLLFSGPDFNGELREVFEPVSTLNDYYFNDRARSAAVLSGAWELCEHADFTGRCVFIRQDVPDLDWYDLDYEVSSARPIYEYTEAEHGLMFERDDYGYIRYADNRHYGYDDYSQGYGVSTRISVYHYGYSPSYRSYGYYNPGLGYGPYGFAWTRHGVNPHYGRGYRYKAPPLRGHYGARKGAVTLYTDSYERGASLGLNQGVSDLSRYRFNDNVSSIRIRTGKWEICEHANFQGRCQIVDASSGKLNGIRLNDNISSIRPVDGSGHGGRRGDADGWRGGPRGDGPRGGGDYRGGRGDGHGGERRPHTDSVTPVRSDTLSGGPEADAVRRPRPGQPVRADINRPDRAQPPVRRTPPAQRAAQPQQTRALPQSPAVRNREDIRRRVEDAQRRIPPAARQAARPSERPAERRPQQARSEPVRPQAVTPRPVRPQQAARPQIQRPAAQARPQVSPPRARPQVQTPRPQARPQPAPRPQPRPQPQPQAQQNRNLPPAMRNRANRKDD